MKNLQGLSLVPIDLLHGSFTLLEWAIKTKKHWTLLGLAQKECALWARRGADELYSAVPRMRSLSIASMERSEIVDSESETVFRDVRAMSPLRAPNVGSFLHGMALRQAFDNFVIFGPLERPAYWQALGASKGGGFSDAVSDRLIFGDTPTVPLETAFLHWKSTLHLKSICEKNLGTKVRLGPYPEMVGRNAAQLEGLLASGAICSDGFWRGDTRERLPIDPQLWTRSDFKIDLRNGDLVNVQTGAVEWASIVLRTPRDRDGPTPRANGATGNRSSELREDRTPAVEITSEHNGIIATIEEWLRRRYRTRPPMKAKELMALVSHEIPELGEFKDSSMYAALSKAFPHR